MMVKTLYPSHPVHCIITGPSECGKSVFVTKLILNNTNECDKIYIYSPSPRQNLYQKIFKYFSIYIAIHKNSNILNEEDIDLVFEEEIVIKEDHEKSDTEMQTYESIEEP